MDELAKKFCLTTMLISHDMNVHQRPQVQMVTPKLHLQLLEVAHGKHQLVSQKLMRF
jgi:hypothetical protein